MPFGWLDWSNPVAIWWVLLLIVGPFGHVAALTFAWGRR